ncbi:hypothetical protein CVFO_0624 [Isorropodon fossajaponicum endosymbiont JTNG4]|uniref:hypothetical protein n=1 Tax=Isorropodon fossajaponicum symbiont TaxID=883811 RepID=UPI001915A222|nr:hypothetical protein [Isorropodon fossajaponicum symbiont]BBB23870.1 hypothetical protein CVFO_0624 [Isorropodon fossajaponicum endosymbiont JTNG4]
MIKIFYIIYTIFNKKSDNIKYSINLKIPKGTVDYLNAGNFELQIFKGVVTPSNSNVSTCVWAKVAFPIETINISWDENYNGYFSTSALNPGVTINMSNYDEMDLGQRYNLTKTGSAHIEKSSQLDAYEFMMEKEEARRNWACRG